MSESYNEIKKLTGEFARRPLTAVEKGLTGLFLACSLAWIISWAPIGDVLSRVGFGLFTVAMAVLLLYIGKENNKGIVRLEGRPKIEGLKSIFTGAGYYSPQMLALLKREIEEKNKVEDDKAEKTINLIGKIALILLVTPIAFFLGKIFSGDESVMSTGFISYLIFLIVLLFVMAVVVCISVSPFDFAKQYSPERQARERVYSYILDMEYELAKEGK